MNVGGCKGAHGRSIRIERGVCEISLQNYTSPAKHHNSSARGRQGGKSEGRPSFGDCVQLINDFFILPFQAAKSKPRCKERIREKIIEGGKRGGRKGEKDTSGVRGERRGRYPSEVAFSLSPSLPLGGREAARTEGNELSRQSSFSRSHFVLTLLSPPSACVRIAIRQPIPPPLVLSLVFPVRLSEKLDFLFLPPHAENALALIAEREKRRVEEGERGGEWQGISTKRINHGESGRKGGRERERQGLFELPFRNFSSLASHERRRRRREQSTFFPSFPPLFCTAAAVIRGESSLSRLSPPPSFPRHRPTPVTLRFILKGGGRQLRDAMPCDAMRRGALFSGRTAIVRRVPVGRGLHLFFLWSVTLNIVCLSGRCGMAT